MYIFGFSTNYIPLKTISLKGIACPYCNHVGELELTFLQLEQDGVVVQRLNKVSGTIKCKSCNQTIPKHLWDDTIKGVFEQEKQQLNIVTSTKLGRTGKKAIAVIVGCILFVAIIFIADGAGLLDSNSKSSFEKAEVLTSQYKKDPKAGDICQVMISEGQNGSNTVFSFYKIVSVNRAKGEITFAADKRSSPNADGLVSDQAEFDMNNLKTFSLRDFENLYFSNQTSDGNVSIRILSVVRL